MLAELNFSEARKQFTEVVDRAQRFEIPVIKPRKKSEDYSAVFRVDLIQALLKKEMISDYKIEVFDELSGTVTISVDPFDIAVNAPTKEAAIEEAIDEIIEYTQEYLNPRDFSMYYNSPNRHSHLALVVKVALSHTREDVKEITGLAKI